MKRSVFTGVVVTTLFLSPQVLAESAEQCAQIENARERLACFDKQFPRADGIPRTLSTAPEPAKPRAPDPVLPSSQNSTAGVQADTGAPRHPPEPSRGERKGLFGWMEKLDMDSEIAAIRSGDQQRMVFRLANDQIWMQSTPRDLPFRQGDKVNIKNGRVGGYIMRSESGTSTRVQRIQ